MGARAMTETTVEAAAVAELRQDFRGPLLAPGDEGYDQARTLWNAMIDKRPELVARCTGAADVLAAIRFARTHGLEIAVRGGGHSVAGNSSTDGGVMIDLSHMRAVRVDPDTRRTLVQGGALLGDVDRETTHFGLVSPGGVVSHTGVAGLTLGGGHGWTQRAFGMACDNVVAYDLVTADAEFVKVTERENAELFWGLRGGGGNFGVVTCFEFAVHEMNPVVYGGPVFFPASEGRRVVELFREITSEAPDELTCLVASMSAPPMPFIPESRHGTPVVVFSACYLGDHAEAERLLAPVRALGPIADVLGPVPYPFLQTALDEWQGHGLQRYWKSDYLTELTDDAIDSWVEHAQLLEGGKAMSGSYIQHLGGAIARVDETDAAYSHRDALYDYTALSGWIEPGDAEENMEWCRRLWEGMRGAASGVYVNNLGAEGTDRIRAAYGNAKYDRLVALKRKYDPQNVFHLNQNITP